MLGFLRQSTASQVLTLGPFIDSADFITAQTALTIANTDVKLLRGGASANKNSGGGTHRANGEYDFTFDATDSATVGRMKVSINVSGSLPVFGYVTVLEEAVYDALFAASAPGYGTAQTGDSYARIGAAGAGLTAVGDTRIANLDATISSRTKPADTQARVTLVDTVTTYTGNTPQTGDGYKELKQRAPVKHYYISSAGSDSNPGTIDLPFLTLDHADVVMADGDKLCVLNIITVSAAFAPTKAYTTIYGLHRDCSIVGAVNGSNPVIDCYNGTRLHRMTVGNSGTGYGIRIESVVDVELDQLTVTGGVNAIFSHANGPPTGIRMRDVYAVAGGDAVVLRDYYSLDIDNLIAKTTCTYSGSAPTSHACLIITGPNNPTATRLNKIVLQPVIDDTANITTPHTLKGISVQHGASVCIEGITVKPLVTKAGYAGTVKHVECVGATASNTVTNTLINLKGGVFEQFTSGATPTIWHLFGSGTPTGTIRYSNCSLDTSLVSGSDIKDDTSTAATQSTAGAASAASAATKTAFLPSITAGAAGGVFIAGTNAATTVNITGNITGNLSGSVGSVTALGAGSIVVGAFANNSITAAAIATDALGSLELAAGAASEIVSALLATTNGAASVAEQLQHLNQDVSAAVGGPIEHKPIPPSRILTVRDRGDGTFGVIGRVYMIPGETLWWGLELKGTQLAAGDLIDAVSAPSVTGAQAAHLTTPSYGIFGTMVKFKVVLSGSALTTDAINIVFSISPDGSEVLKPTVPVTVGP